MGITEGEQQQNAQINPTDYIKCLFQNNDFAGPDLSASRYASLSSR
jgi:hypothetical protein